MCGIIGVKVVKAKKIRKSIKRIYTQQVHRGTDGYGVAIGVNGEIIRHRSKGEDIFNPSNWRDIQNGASVLFHHRIPTSTPNMECCNHPIMNEKQTMALIHNGMVSQYLGIWTELEEEGHKFETELRYNTHDKGEVTECAEITDSEVLVHLLEGHKDFGEGVKKLVDTIGYFSAFAFIRKNDDKIYLYSNGMPLCVYEDKHGNIFFSSENPYGNYYNNIELSHGEYGYIDENGYKKLGKVKRDWKLYGGYYSEGDYDYGKGYKYRDDDQFLAGGNVLTPDELEAKMEEWKLTPLERDSVAYLVEAGYTLDEAVEEVVFETERRGGNDYNEKYQKYKGKHDEYYKGQSETMGVGQSCLECGDMECDYRGSDQVPAQGSTCFIPKVKET